MAERVTNNELDEVISIWCNSIGSYVAESYKDVGGYRLDSAYGGVRVVKVVSGSGGERDISPRLSKREMLDWLRAGISLALEKARSDGNYE